MSNQKLILTLCLLIRSDGKVALAKKLRSHGAGKWNGYGGKIEEGETIKEAAIRETAQESEVEVSPLYMQKTAELEFHFDGEELVRQMHVFVCRRWEGEPKATEEMGEPRWFARDELPQVRNEMWPADPIWMPMVLDGKTVRGKFYYDAGGSRVENYELAQDIYLGAL